MWNKIKEWLKSIWKKFLTWFKKNWFMIVNYLVIIISYSTVYGHEGVLLAEVLLGFWIFVSIVYPVFKWFMKKK
jgi:hypothetical protein